MSLKAGTLHHWQDKLKLEDWNIEVRFVRGNELDGSQAKMVRNAQHRTAIIRISLDHADELGDLTDEQRLVHELQHVYHYNENQDAAEVQSEEQGINAVTFLLVEAYGVE